MHIVLQKHETTDDKLATGLLLGLWVGETLATVEYWLLRTSNSALRALVWWLRRPVLLALLLPLSCFGLLGTVALARIRQARTEATVIDEKIIATGAALYRAETGHWPVTLEKLVPKYLKALRPDPWGQNYALYRGEGGIAIVSAGRDGELGTADDVIFVPPES